MWSEGATHVKAWKEEDCVCVCVWFLGDGLAPCVLPISSYKLIKLSLSHKTKDSC